MGNPGESSGYRGVGKARPQGTKEGKGDIGGSQNGPSLKSDGNRREPGVWVEVVN